MHDLPLAIFTVLSQMAIGAFITMWLLELRNKDISYKTGVLISVSITIIGSISVLFSLFHLGHPFAAYRAILNIGRSWLSREVTLYGGFIFLSGLYTYFWWKGDSSKRFLCGVFGTIVGLATIFSSAMIYVIPAIPAWDSLSTIVAFFVTGLILGPLFTGMLLQWKKELSFNISFVTLIGLAISALTVAMYTSSLFGGLPEAVATGELMLDSSLFWGRIMAFIIALFIFLLAHIRRRASHKILYTTGFVLLLASEFLGRVLFYTSAIHL
ncbi:DmsC/YnfH family molybdoenzyme membrane anchor subunit [Bacillus sp. DTU_2020_1000418_1_SI_GHA_SEK_038]|uniref:dimethyl sulfoxide reductase anchor subunit family protein n=1 Tax=Bacillus sp. DTU_2020_1000418_1_SI_GHA_SEK_038 TaxID=3077585 RepID=UPI0028EAEB1D|nr:DmsC/YnfH family molybdoenzyme membrane anchor subunit [Bacillus sp. DTU_2020_1000418_1_SI_GHA_SEK_038]WNS74069.1 DmsC/YnfH family molybdoenzyme membrane anchor subunit [Bacillus sp. DTU_2020_1000418_1_SI_GHA_SEK_038]